MPRLAEESAFAVIDRNTHRAEEAAIHQPTPEYDLKGIAMDCLSYSPVDLQAYVNFQKSLPPVDLNNCSIFYNLRDAGVSYLREELGEKVFKVGRTYPDQLQGAGYIAYGIHVDLDPKLEWKDAASRLPTLSQLMPEQLDHKINSNELEQMLSLLTDFAGYKLFKSQSFGQLNAVINLCEQVSATYPTEQKLVDKTLQAVSAYAEKALILLSEDLKFKPNYQFAPHYFLDLKVELEQVVTTCQSKMANAPITISINLSEESLVSDRR